MPVAIVPPGRNASAAALQKIFEDTQDKLIREILRKRSKGYVDYAEVAALERVRKTLQKMVKGAEKYVPLAVEHEFYNRPESAEAYRNARESINPGRARAVEILSDNLMGEIEEMAETAYQSTASKLFLVGRAEEDIFRQAGITQAIEASAAGRGSLTTVNEIVSAIQNTGITAFVDKAGHEWNLKAYGSMAVRTTVRQAQVAAVLTENQHDLYKIINTGVPCRWCAAYGGRVYSKSGMNKNYPPLSAAFGRIDTSGSDSIYNSFLNIHPNCLVPGGLVLAEGVVSESRRLYSGKVVTLKTSAGNEITVTPNHPILTDRGFVAADLLHEGDKIIEASGEYARFFRQAPNDINIPTAVDKIFHALVETGGGSTHCVKSTSEQFHGDGIPDGEVDIVFTDRLGRGVSNALRIKPVTEKNFPTAQLGRVKFLADCPLFKVGKRPLFAPDSIMRRFGFVSGVERNAKNLHDLADSERANTAPFRNLGICKALLMKGAECFKHFSMLVKVLLGNNAVGFSTAPTLGANDPGFSFGKSNGVLGDTELLRNLRTGETVVDERLKHFTGHNALVVSTLTHKETSFYNGYVYNFETEHSFYVYNNIVTHNCLCSLVPYYEEDYSPEQVEKDRLYSDPARRPFDLDYRTKAVKEAYEQKERNRAVYRSNVKQYRRYLESGVPGMPKTFQTFLKHKRLNDDKYREWMAAFRKRGKVS